MAERSNPLAPGWPGIPARWTSSAKSGLGTAVRRDSRVWFTLSHGILNEVYYPRVDLPTEVLPSGGRIDLTFYWPDAMRWEGVDFFICVE